MNTRYFALYSVTIHYSDGTVVENKMAAKIGFAADTIVDAIRENDPYAKVHLVSVGIVGVVE